MNTNFSFNNVNLSSLIKMVNYKLLFCCHSFRFLNSLLKMLFELKSYKLMNSFYFLSAKEQLVKSFHLNVEIFCSLIKVICTTIISFRLFCLRSPSKQSAVEVIVIKTCYVSKVQTLRKPWSRSKKLANSLIKIKVT